MNTRLSLLACLAFSAACHSSNKNTASSDMTMVDPPDLAPPGDMATPFPAVSDPDVPQTVSYGGPVIANPKVVVVTFPNEDKLADIETFVSTLGDQPYWAAAVGEYGVGKITMLASIKDPVAPPATITDQDIETYISNKINDSTSGWPAPDNDTIYAIYYPSTTVIDDGGGSKSCESFGGYHADTGVANTNQRAIYAVMPRCTGVFTHDPAQGDFGYLTSASSHEFIEASEDPFPFTNPAYSDTDDAHFHWEISLGGGETGDLCAQNTNADFKPEGFDYWVQRNWSNEAAAGAKDPCVPAPADTIYGNITPVTEFDKLALFGTHVDGFNLEVGVPREIDFVLYSDKPTSAPMTVAVKDFSAYINGTASKVMLDTDNKMGVNGTHIKLTITAKQAFSGHGNTDTVLITTTTDGIPKFWFGLFKTVASTTPPADMGI